jgi:predicted PilT family ATPase
MEPNRVERRDENNQITQSLPIPEYKMGWIIGKKGTYINQLAKKSGATITISDSKSKEYGTVWKYVQITGTGRAVDRAKKLLHIRLERLEPRDEISGRPDENINENGEEVEGLLEDSQEVINKMSDGK